jgi:hypothetical protein
MSEPIRISFQEEKAGLTLKLAAGNEEWLHVRPPFRVCLLSGDDVEGSYAAVYEKSGKWVASGKIASSEGTSVEVTDSWRSVDETTVQVDRDVKVLVPGTSPAFRVEFCSETKVSEAETLDDWEFCIPGALYKKNDTDHDGIEDYLRTYTQDYRDDRLPSLAVLAYLPRRRSYVALARCNQPENDRSISSEQLVGRRFIQNTDIGSLGIETLQRPSLQILLRASYPFCERFSFCLNTDRGGWAAYLENRCGAEFRVSYRLIVGPADSLTDAIWEVTKSQMATLGTTVQKPNFSLEDSLDYRMTLTQQYYRKWDKAENPKEPAGYMVHFSPRSGATQGTLLEYGFSGAQPLLAYVSLRYGYLKQMPLWTDRARTVIDFFVNHCQLENGFSHGIYDVARQEFVYWFTGILLPFQYAQDEISLRRLLGSQVTKSLAPVAQELRRIKGNYTRTMCESIYPILLAYKTERKHGHKHDPWLVAGERFGAFLLKTQGNDGSWFRGYDSAGNGLESPPEWFGFSDTEKKSGTIFPIEVLDELYQITGNRSYLEAAEKAGSFIIRTYVDPVEYVGGLNDTTHIKSVKIDSVGVMFVMRSLLKLCETTGKKEYRKGP